MKTIAIISLPYSHALALTPEQAAAFIKLVQGAEVVRETKWNDERDCYDYERTTKLPGLYLINADQVKDPEPKTEE